MSANPAEVTVELTYFAILQQKRGVESESVVVSTQSVSELYSALDAKHRFELDHALVRYAVNGHYVEGDYVIEGGDQIVFIPPVSGG